MRLANFKITNWEEWANRQKNGDTLLASPLKVLGTIDEKLLIRVGEVYAEDATIKETMAIAADSLDEKGDFQMFSLDRRLKFNPYGVELDV